MEEQNPRTAGQETGLEERVWRSRLSYGVRAFIEEKKAQLDQWANDDPGYLCRMGSLLMSPIEMLAIPIYMREVAYSPERRSYVLKQDVETPTIDIREHIKKINLSDQF